MKKYEVKIKQIQIQIIELPENEEFNEDTFWNEVYDLGDCELDTEIESVELLNEDL